jgi:rSAM/selenodomain-associated transferase 1
VPDPQARILIFAKTPRPGRVKTRLIPALGPVGAAAVHRLLLEQVLRLAVESDLCPVQFWYTPSGADSQFRRWRGRPGLTFHRQPPGDLGRRMRLAAQRALAEADRVLIIGTDCPVWTRGDLADALGALGDHDAVLTPAEDGGFLLLGLRRVAPELFEEMPWGTDRVMAETRARLRRLGWRWREQRTLWDVDRPVDLRRLAALDPGWAWVTGPE